MDALRNSDQSAAEGRLGFSKAVSLIGEPTGLRLVFEEGVRGSLYKLLKAKPECEHGHMSTWWLLLSDTFCYSLPEWSLSLDNS